MHLPRYELTAEKSLMIFDFVSEGIKGKILKLIKISETELPGFYNLAFGDKDSTTDDFSDSIISNNGDSEKVLATIVYAVYLFTAWKPEAWIYATGSTKSRTRLYRMGIAKYADEINQDFVILGLLNNEWEIFRKKVNYDAFLGKRKDSSFER